MANKVSKVFVIIAAALVIGGFVYIQDRNTLFGTLIEPIEPVDWSEVKSRYIIEYSIPITLHERNGNECTVNAKGFYPLTTHGKFTHSNELANKLKFDNSTDTIIIPCNEMKGDPSEFTVWYVSPESNIHKGKYEYYIDPYDGTLGRGVNYWNQTGSTVKTNP